MKRSGEGAPEQWLQAVAASEVAEDRMLGIDLGGRRILLARVQGRIYACLDRCPHAGVALSEGNLKEGRIQCRQHGWIFDVETGGSVPGPSAFCLERLMTEIRADGMIWVGGEVAEG